MNETTLIIPDLHLRHEQAEKIIKYVGPDKIIFLGDLWDDFGDTPETVKDTSEWFTWSIQQPNRIHLGGNHCIHYMYAYSSFQCSGYTQWKYFLINDIVSRDDWNKLKWYHFLDNRWLLSHGGLHKFNLPESITKFRTDRPKFIAEISSYLDHEILEGLRNGANKTGSWIFNAGLSRGGCNRVGGIIWCDFEKEFYPVQGINQIVGHTPQGLGFPKWCVLDKMGDVSYYPYHMFTPKLKQLDDPDMSINIDLDVYKNTHWAIWNGKEMEFGNYKDL